MKAYIEKNYHNMTYREMADELGVTFYTLSKKVGLMLASGELEGKSKKWTQEDDEFLMQEYEHLSREELANVLGTSVANVYDRYFKLKHGIIGLSPKAIARRKAKQDLRDKKIVKIYNAALIKGNEEDRKQGLILDNLKLNIGSTYKIKQPGLITEKNKKVFKGKLKQICDRHLVFQNNKGYCESFLKVDLLLEHEYQEVI